MKESLRKKLFEIFEIEQKAAIKQGKNGKTDNGRRKEVTSGKHLDPIAKYITKELISFGLDKDDIYRKKNLSIPGWYRATKSWDLLAFKDKSLIAAIELKSMGSSYGKNSNNRVEEALGSSVDAHTALKYDLYKSIQPPLFGYVMVLRADDESRKIVKKINENHFKVDPIFYDTTYLERFKILCSRMLQEKLYDAIWLVYVDIDNKEVFEPVPALSYDNFIRKLKCHVELFSD